MLYTSEQFANKVHGVPKERRSRRHQTDRDRQDRQTRTSSSRSSTDDDDDEYLREVSRLSEHDLELG